jgi:hypothetical protein
MRRLLLPLALSLLALLAFAATASARSSYCSPSGDFCYGVSEERDPKIVLHMAARYFPKARICVTPPGGAERTCKTYKVKDLGKVFGVRIRWSAKFPNEGRGTYKVKFYSAGSTSEGLGPSVSFRR